MLSLGTIAQLKPEVVHKLDVNAWADAYSDMLGVNPEMIVANDKVAIILQKQADAQAAMQQEAVMQQRADTAAKLASAKTGDEQNALTDVTRAYSGYT